MDGWDSVVVGIRGNVYNWLSYGIVEYSNASEPPFYRLRATSDFNTLEPPQTQDIVMEP